MDLNDTENFGLSFLLCFTYLPIKREIGIFYLLGDVGREVTWRTGKALIVVLSKAIKPHGTCVYKYANI